MKKPNKPEPISPEKLAELQAVLREIDPAGRLEWTLEVQHRRNGGDFIDEIYDLKSCKPKRAGREMSQNVSK